MPDATEGFTLWYRPSRRHKWQAVGTRPTPCESLCLMESSGHHNGHWCVRLANDPPERAKEQPTLFDNPQPTRMPD